MNFLRVSCRLRISPQVFAASLVCLGLLAGCSRGVPAGKSAAAKAPRTEKATSAAQQAELMRRARAKELYTVHCEACHGEKGDGNGPAAPYLDPPPRNFARAEFRLVTSVNRVPSDADLTTVLERGMPGSAMLPQVHIPEQDRRLLVDYIRQLAADGVRERVVSETAQVGLVADPQEVAEIVAERTQPAPRLEVGSADAVTAETVARGKVKYDELCASCHGKTGKGDGVEEQFDSLGRPTRPRDLTRGIFKGRPEFEDVYARLWLGMPGTPMPDHSGLTEQQVADLVHYVLSLSEEQTREQMVMRRRTIRVHRLARELARDATSSLWNAIEPVRLTTMPLWWQEYDDLNLYVQAAHDDAALAVRLSWRDPTGNEYSVRPGDFEDMAAVQLFEGTPEPFLGMGGADAPVDVWHWRPSGGMDLASYPNFEASYPNIVDDSYPFEEAIGAADTDTTRHDGADVVASEPAGRLRATPAGPAGGSSLESEGFGTLTMRPEVSQIVYAAGTWSDGQWTVVLQRLLEPSGGEGIGLTAGKRVSIAFALWDGARGDRGAQKRITIWHELDVE